MNRITLSELEIKANLFPFSQVRHVADIRVGILTIREKWEHYLGHQIETEEVSPLVIDDSISFSANILPSREFVDSCLKGSPDYSFVRILQFPWHIFQWNDWSIRNDFEILTHNRVSAEIPADVLARNPEHIFIEPGAEIAPCFLNASSGPIYIGKDAVIMDGAMIYGPVAVCENAVVKMGAKIYGATTIGPHCTAGGEVKNSVLMGYSNKAHDGYLGDSAIGEWCNLGAGTTNSNVKNTAGIVRMWHPVLKEYISVGHKCGLIMGDFSRSAINTSFNTGTMVGIAANVFGNGLTPKYIPSFSWGMEGPKRSDIDKTIEHISNWMKFKQKELSDNENQSLRYIFEHY